MKTLTATIQATTHINAAAAAGALPGYKTEQGWSRRREVTLCKHGLNVLKQTTHRKVGRDYVRMKRIAITPCKSWDPSKDYTKAERRRIAFNICRALRARGLNVRVETTKGTRYSHERDLGAVVVGTWTRGW